MKTGSCVKFCFGSLSIAHRSDRFFRLPLAACPLDTNTAPSNDVMPYKHDCNRHCQMCKNLETTKKILRRWQNWWRQLEKHQVFVPISLRILVLLRTSIIHTSRARDTFILHCASLLWCTEWTAKGSRCHSNLARQYHARLLPRDKCTLEVAIVKCDRIVLLSAEGKLKITYEAIKLR